SPTGAIAATRPRTSASTSCGVPRRTPIPTRSSRPRRFEGSPGYRLPAGSNPRSTKQGAWGTPYALVNGLPTILVCMCLPSLRAVTARPSASPQSQWWPVRAGRDGGEVVRGDPLRDASVLRRDRGNEQANESRDDRDDDEQLLAAEENPPARSSD